MERIASGLSYPVGLIATADGALIVGEGGSGRVIHLAADGARRVVARVGGAPMGVARTADGAFVVADNGGRFPPAPSTGDEPGAEGGVPAVHRFGADGTVGRCVDSIDGRGLLAPNGVCVDAAGGVWFADSLWDFGDAVAERGCLGYLHPDGTATRVPTDLRFPAGVALDASGASLYVCESVDGGIWSFGVIGPGRLGAPAQFASLGPDAVPSGIALDCEGRVLVTGHLSGCVHVYDPAGRSLDGFDAGRTSGLGHLAFGGPDMTTLFIGAAASGEIFATEWSTPGLRLPGASADRPTN